MTPDNCTVRDLPPGTYWGKDANDRWQIWDGRSRGPRLLAAKRSLYDAIVIAWAVLEDGKR